jgi:hypothetical protein
MSIDVSVLICGWPIVQLADNHRHSVADIHGDAIYAPGGVRLIASNEIVQLDVPSNRSQPEKPGFSQRPLNGAASLLVLRRRILATTCKRWWPLS